MTNEKIQINYIKHHIHAKQVLATKKGRRPNHVSMYEALFSLWNHYRFPEVFFVNREELMSMSFIGSKNTYTKVIKQLDSWGLIKYLPSFDPLTASKIHMIRFDLTFPKTGNGNGKSSGKGTEKANEQVMVKVVGPLYKQEEIIENNIKEEERKENDFLSREKELRELFK